MLEIVKLKNPFDRTRREIEHVNFIPGKVLTDYVSDGEIEYILNGNFVEAPGCTYPTDGDQVIVMAHVGNGGFNRILATVASIALMTYAGNVAGGLWGTGAGTLTSYLAAGAVMYVGGRIINSVFPVQQQNTLDTASSSPTYGWDTPQPVTGEGNIVGITYGECIPAPQVLERHVETVNGKQYLNLLLCGGMGPVDSIYDIKNGSTPIGNFKDVQIETRLGTNDQEPISFFNDTPLDQAVAMELTETGTVQTSDSTGAVGLEVTVEFPGGLYYVNDDGSFANATIELALFYRKYGDTNWINWIHSDPTETVVSNSNPFCLSINGVQIYAGAIAETVTISCTQTVTYSPWGDTIYSPKFSVVGSVSGGMGETTSGQVFDNGKIRFSLYTSISDMNSLNVGDAIVVSINTNSNWAITAAQNTAVRQSTRVDGLQAGKYDVKVVVASRQIGSRYCNNCTWSVLTAYNPGKYARPNKVLVGLRMLATGQLSGGIPDITWRQMRSTVYVWNPCTDQYETRSARNPIWAAYDIYHQCRYLKNINTGQYEYVAFGVDHNRLDPHWDEWIEAAAYANDQIAGLDGTLENRFEFDVFYDTARKRHDAAQLAANVGHAVIMPHGNNIGIKCDKPGQMVQIFGEGRTTMASLQGTFSGTDDRAKAVEVVYSETNNDFKNTQFLIRSPKWNTSTGAQDNPAQLQLFGVKRRSQAYREGTYTLANNELVTQFVDLGTDIDALVCRYGDIVGLNHSVGQMGIASGRIVVASINTVQLDKTVPLQAGLTYQIILQLSDDTLVTKNIVSSARDMDTDTLTVTEPFSVLPQQFDNYVFGETGKAVKPFRLVGVQKDGDLRCKLNLAEYIDGVYSGDLNYPIIDYTPPGNKLFDVSNLMLAEENYRAKDGTNVSLLHVSWTVARGSSADEFLIYYSENQTDWKFWGSTESSAETITNVAPLRTYYVKVCVATGGMRSAGVVENIYLTGKDALPSDITSFSVAQSGSSVYFIYTKPIDIDFKYAEIREGISWDVSTLVARPPDSKYETTIFTNGDKTYWIKAVDNSGNYSKNAKSFSITLTNAPNVNTILTMEYPFNSYIPSWKMNDSIRMNDDITMNSPTTPYGYFGAIPTWRMNDNIRMNDELAKMNMPYPFDQHIYINQPDKVIDLGEITTTSLNIDFVIYPQIKNVSTIIEIRTSSDGETYSDWQQYCPGKYTCRYINVRVKLTSLNNKSNPYVETVILYIDVDDVTFEGNLQIITPGWAKYTFPKSGFRNVPSAYYVQHLDYNTDAYIRNVTNKDFEAIIIDRTTGNPVGGSFYYYASGY